MKEKLNLSPLEQKLYRIKVKDLREQNIYQNGVVMRPRYYQEVMIHQSAKLYIKAYQQMEKYPINHPLRMDWGKYK